MGQLLVSDRATNQINRYDASTGDFLGVLVGGDPSTNGGLLAPSALTLGPNDELLVASQFTGSVLRYDLETGDFLGVFADQINVPAGLLYNEEDDELFVSTLGNFDSELIFRYRASTGELLSAMGEGTGASGRTAMLFGPDSNLYAASFANGMFFTGAVLQFDSETHESSGVFAQNNFLAGANGMEIRAGEAPGTYELDVVGLFSNNVARFDLADTDDGLAVQSSELLITENLDFPSAIQDLADGTMLVTNLGNDKPATGDLRPGSIAQFDIASGDFITTFIAAGGEGGLQQPTALLLLPASVDVDCNGDGVVDAADLQCACSAGIRNDLLAALDLMEGDLDGDGEVGFPDFLTLSANFGQAADYSIGDIDCSGTVDFADFLVLSANFGQTAAIAAVPEPNSAALLGPLCLMMFLRRRLFRN
jgi:hypothetical protein